MLLVKKKLKKKGPTEKRERNGREESIKASKKLLNQGPSVISLFSLDERGTKRSRSF
jgi:hypothetical protein